jgi:iron complex outermembrane recepter protein
MRKNVFLLAFIFLISATYNLHGQTNDARRRISGTVTSATGEILQGVSVILPGTTQGTITDLNGRYAMLIAPGSYTLSFSFVGYETVTREVVIGQTDQVVDIILTETAASLNEVVILGSRAATARTNIDKPVAVDVINTREIKNFAQADLSQILNYVAPSFSSNRQTVADGTDHIDPASLRGLGTDQVLLLVNGKRRHTTALVNINGTFGRGSVGTDMNAIPVAAIDRIEVLRDGASAQYGSDAIAGVVNIVLKKKSPLILSTTYGQSLSNTFGEKFTDGKTFQLDGNKSFSLGKNGFINVGGQLLHRDGTNRGGPDTRPLLYSALPSKAAGESEADFLNRYKTLKAADDAKASAAGLDRNTMLVGNSQSTNAGVFANAEYKISPTLTGYFAGGYSARKGKAAGFYRLPVQTSQVDLSLYPNGFLPFINTTIKDLSAIAGIKGEVGKWSYDVSNTFGTNSVDFHITNTMNASLPAGTSPKEFDAGVLKFSQNTVNLDLARRFNLTSGILSSLHIGYGAEFRLDKYQITAGEELSYSYGQPSKNIDGLPGKAAGAQVFPGFRPSNAIDQSRNSKGIYADIEAEFGPRLLIDVAGRFENFSDFGSNFSYKFSGRFKIYNEFAIRGGIATGFRAPSLHQHYFNNESTQFVQGQPTQVLTVNNEHPIVREFGVGSLKPEISTSYNLGITGELLNSINFTIDAYQIDIDNRIVFSSQYARERDAGNNLIATGKVNQILNTVDPGANVNSVQFFTNAITTRTKGIDIVLSDRINTTAGNFFIVAAANFNNTKVTDIQGTEVIEGDQGLKAKLFDRLERSRYESSVPKSKITFSVNYNVKKWSILLRTVRFGEVTYLNAVDPHVATNNLPTAIDQTFSAKWITDVSISYALLKSLNLTLGANNIFDVYPDKAYIDPRNSQFNLSGDPSSSYTTGRDNTSNGHFLYSRNVSQFGFNGRYVFAKLTFQL